MNKVAEVELIYRSKVKASERIKVRSSSEVHKVFREYWDDDKIDLCEEFKVLFLNRASKCLGIFNLSQGGVAGTVVDVKLIFSAALRANASSIVIAHNHPSGNFYPSQADLKITRRVRQAGSILDISLIDHLIITSEGYYSMADDGVL